MALGHTLLISAATMLHGKTQISHLWSSRVGVEPYTNRVGVEPVHQSPKRPCCVGKASSLTISTVCMTTMALPCEVLRRSVANSLGDDSLKSHISLLWAAMHAVHAMNDSVQQARPQDRNDLVHFLICDAYISLFDDMTIHKDVWLEKLLHPTGHPVVGHATANFLSHLVMAHTIRNEHARCKAILKLEALTLACFDKQI